MLTCYKCKTRINPSAPSVTWDMEKEEYVHRGCLHLSTKLSKVKMHLLRGGSLTAVDSVRYWGYHRLSSGINVLRKRDLLPVETATERNPKSPTSHWARYFIPVEWLKEQRKEVE